MLKSNLKQEKATEKCAELKDISKYIEYSTSISETVSFESDNHTKQGWFLGAALKNTWKQKRTWSWICSQQKQKSKGVDFGGDSSEYGTFDFEGDTEVAITDLFDNDEGCSKEALENGMKNEKKIVKQKAEENPRCWNSNC